MLHIVDDCLSVFVSSDEWKPFITAGVSRATANRTQDTKLNRPTTQNQSRCNQEPGKLPKAGKQDQETSPHTVREHD